MKSKTCCFTGHRDIPYNEVDYLNRRLYEEIEKLVKIGVIYYGSGGARGFDLMSANVVVELKKKYPQIRLIMVLPCPKQTRNWNFQNKSEYKRILESADKIKLLSDKYSEGCMLTRNRHLVDNSLYVICYKRKNKGGTAYTVDYAKRNNKVIIEI